VDSEHKPDIPIRDSDHTDEYFVELCALATSGTLTAAEWNHLEAHLSLCQSCRAVRSGYERALATHLPAMASAASVIDDGPAPTSFSIKNAEAALFARIDREHIAPEKPTPSKEISSPSRKLWLMPIAATLFIGCTYAVSRFAVMNSAPRPVISGPTKRTSAFPQPVSREATNAQGNSPRADKRTPESEMASLERRLKTKAAMAISLMNQRQWLVEQLSTRESELTLQAQRNGELEQRLSLAEAREQRLRIKLEQAAATQQALRIASMDALQHQIDDLKNDLDERTQQLAKQAELLEHDRDIRNLIGARDLYIGEIYDIAKSGKTQKPFGRVFYTQGKSLVFYAYDLNQQPGIKLASTFQAWGRRGVDQNHDVSLGIFYQDDQNKTRWILKSNDTVTLTRLDAVFVTVEPHGESSKPTGKPLLFTYLRLPPNHP
jgi:hypothetical protein